MEVGAKFLGIILGIQGKGHLQEETLSVTHGSLTGVREMPVLPLPHGGGGFLDSFQSRQC